MPFAKLIYHTNLFPQRALVGIRTPEVVTPEGPARPGTQKMKRLVQRLFQRLVQRRRGCVVVMQGRNEKIHGMHSMMAAKRDGRTRQRRKQRMNGNQKLRYFHRQ